MRRSLIVKCMGNAETYKHSNSDTKIDKPVRAHLFLLTAENNTFHVG